VEIDRFVDNSLCKQHWRGSVIKGASFTPRKSSTLSFPMFRSTHVLQYRWKVEFFPVKDCTRSSGGDGEI